MFGCSNPVLGVWRVFDMFLGGFGDSGCSRCVQEGDSGVQGIQLGGFKVCSLLSVFLACFQGDSGIQLGGFGDSGVQRGIQVFGDSGVRGFGCSCVRRGIQVFNIQI